MSGDLHDRSISGLLLIFILYLTFFATGGMAQETQSQPSPGSESTYSVKLEIELQDNERNTEESNYSDVYQKKSQKRGFHIIYYRGRFSFRVYYQNT